MSERWVLWGMVVVACSGIPGLLLSRQTTLGQWFSLLAMLVGSALGLIGIGRFWSTGAGAEVELPWAVVSEERFVVALDGISALFLMPIFLISLLGSIYGLEYWNQLAHRDNGRKLRLFYGLLPAGMVLLVIARHGLLFMIGWEIMALAAFFLVTTEDHEAPVRKIGWMYLLATHIATLFLFALFTLLRKATGSFLIVPLAENEVSPSLTTAILVLAILGFGIKAGIMPLHVWLPSSHAIAPSHVSAIMSGVIIKMGIYGIVRVSSLVPQPPLAFGIGVLVLGVISGILGVAYALGQHDIKRLLAYHSIENIGIIVMGIGLALIGRSLGQSAWVLLGMSAALLHVWNHALFKALLFLSAGSVIHAVHTREIDQLGGLAKAMPGTALGFLIGAVAICGLPPLNGFISEFLLYLGLLHTLGQDGGVSLTGVAFAAPALALIGTLAVACFAKVFGAVFLGTSRATQPVRAHESGWSMLGPMAILALCCLVIGVAPGWIAPLLEKGVADWAPELRAEPPRLAALVPLGWLTSTGLILIGLLMAGSLFLWCKVGSNSVTVANTWGCGFVAPSARMQYTSSSFAETLIGLFAWVLLPKKHQQNPCGLFPAPTHFESEVPDTVLDDVVLPTFRFGGWLFSWLRPLQQGSIQTYLFYLFLILLVLLVLTWKGL